MGKIRIIDLGVPIEPGLANNTPEIQHVSHATGVPGMMASFGCQKEDLSSGLGWAVDMVKMSTHDGTHVDAPWHYAPTSEGKKARTIDQMPLEWFYSDGVVIDMRHKPHGSGITIEDMKAALKKINYTLKPNDIVCIQTGADKLWGTPNYFGAGCGMTRESTLWVLNQGIHVVGTDAWGWDRPFWAQKEEFQKNHDKSILWAGHYVGIEKEYCHIEKLANLDKLPRPYGFKIACFPIKVVGGSAGWSRVVGIVEE
ncbi:MAG: cyclase family protein [Dehalococcoidales bacterium]|nr:cyclase family protein [Dehalococcoidales bacterium]